MGERDARLLVRRMLQEHILRNLGVLGSDIFVYSSKGLYVQDACTCSTKKKNTVHCAPRSFHILATACIFYKNHEIHVNTLRSLGLQ